MVSVATALIGRSGFLKFWICSQMTLENVLIDHGHIVKITRGYLPKSVPKRWVNFKGHDLSCTLSRKLRQGTNPGLISMTLAWSSISAVSTIFVGYWYQSRTLPKGLFKGKTVTLQ